MRAADWNPGDDVAHQIEDAVTAEVVGRSEKAGAVAEVDLGTEDASTHRSGIDAEPRASVVEVDVAVAEAGTGVRRHPWAHIPIRACLGRRPDESDRRHHNASLQCTSHVSTPCLAGASTNQAPACATRCQCK